jgi:predicted nucleotidyltransferase
MIKIESSVVEDLPLDAIAAFCQRHGIRRAAVFGSILRADFNADSDIDILVEFESGRVPGLAFFSMEEELSGILGQNVDLNTLGFLSPYFRDSVISEAQVIYELIGNLESMLPVEDH